MKTFYDRKTTAGLVVRVSLAGCMILVGAGLVLGLYPARSAAQPGAEVPKGEARGKRLNHIDLVVANVGENRAFFEKHFGFKTLVEFPDKLAVTTDGAGMTLVLSSPEIAGEIGNFQRTGTTEPKDKGADRADARKAIVYPAGFHIGFHQDSKEAVDEIYKKLQAAKVEVNEPKDYHGAWTFFAKAPGGFYVEVFHQSRRGDGR
jgi:catechol 2,3-dioxygenase-like lactoylglutathione lyase family enzyme